MNRLSPIVLWLAWCGSGVATLADDTDLEDRPYLRIDLHGHTAPVRGVVFSPDGKYLCTAGQDKVVRVWHVPISLRQPGQNSAGVNAWYLERNIRWEVGDGPNGIIYGLAVAPRSPLIAFAGDGHRGTQGEIVLADIMSGRLTHYEYEGDVHAFSVAALAFSTDGRWLASGDAYGRVLARQVGPRQLGQLVELQPADQIETPVSRPLAVLPDGRVVAPVCAEPQGNPRVWQLRLYSPAAGAPGRIPFETLKAKWYGAVTALAADPDGRCLASADLTKGVRVSELATGEEWDLPIDGIVLSMHWSPQGRLAVGTGVDRKTGKSRFEVWDTTTRKRLRGQALDQHVFACANSPDGKLAVYSGGPENSILVMEIDSDRPPEALPGGQRITRVGFVGDGYAIFSEAIVAGQTRRTIFDPAKLQLQRAAPLPAAPRRRDGWEARIEPQSGAVSLWEHRRFRGQVKLDPMQQGTPTAFRWIIRTGRPAAIAVGSDLGSISVYDAASQSLRVWLRGFQGRVNAIDVSADGKYLVAGADDGTVRLWNLHCLDVARDVPRRWGAEFGRRGNSLVLMDVDDRGPAYRIGLRERDVVTSIQWPLDGTFHEARDPDAMYRQLGVSRCHVPVTFTVERGGKPLDPKPQDPAAWPELLAFFADPTRWVAWTPPGYYAASVGGEQLIGWQVNRKLRQQPEFFPASDFFKSLYRPDVIGRLLQEGSVAAALISLQVQEEHRVQVSEILPPTVRILAPGENEVVAEEAHVEVRASAQSNSDHPITRMAILLNGSPPSEQARAIVRETRNQEQTWVVPIRPGKHEIVVVAETAVSRGQSVPVTVVYEPSKARRSLYVLAVGIATAYPERHKLAWASRDALQIQRLFSDQRYYKELFDNVEVKLLAEDQATCQGILDGFQWLKDKMQLGDVGVFFFSGHGLRDSQGQFHFVTADVDMTRIAQTCLSQQQVETLCHDVGGKGNLVLLVDACHSGAFHVDHLARTLQMDYGTIVFCSSTGEQVSREDPDLRGGYFAVALMEGLQGKAATSRPPLQVLYNNLYGYVHERVVEWTAGAQTPVLSCPAIAPFALSRVPTARHVVGDAAQKETASPASLPGRR